MITKMNFLRCWALLCERYQRPDSEAMREFYETALSECLNNEQFLLGVKVVMIQKNFFPSPEEIIDAGLGDLVLHASNQWQLYVQNNLANVSTTNSDEIARAVISSLGGAPAIFNLEVDKQLRIREVFVKEYVARAKAQRAKNAPMLPPPTKPPEAQQATSSEPTPLPTTHPLLEALKAQLKPDEWLFLIGFEVSSVVHGLGGKDQKQINLEGNKFLIERFYKSTARDAIQAACETLNLVLELHQKE